MNSDRQEKLSVDISSSSSRSSEEEKALQLSHPFATWSNEEIDALNQVMLDGHHQDLTQNLVLIMNNWVHQLPNGWYQIQNNKLKTILAASRDKAHPTEVQLGLIRYLETANKLKKPKQGQVERRELPTSKKIIQKFVHVYLNFWHQCAYLSFHNYLSNLSRFSADAFTNNKGKIYIYALLKLKNQILPALLEKKQLSPDDTKQLLIDIDKVILSISAKANIDLRLILLSEEHVYASLDVLHEVMPRHFKLLDLRREFESSSAFARYVHVRPSALIQYAQLIDYIYKIYADDATEITTLLRRKYSIIDKTKANQVLNILDTKRHEIALVMAFQEKLLQSYGIADFIEVIQSIVNNTSAKLLPTVAFFEFESRQVLPVGDFEATDPDAPKEIELQDQSLWRREYIALHAREAAEITPIVEHEVNVWLNEQAAIKDINQKMNDKNIIPTQLLRVISQSNLEQHQLFLISEEPADASEFKQAKYDNAYIFVETPPRIIFMKNSLAKAVEIKSMKLFSDLIKAVKVHDKSKPIQPILDKKRLGFFRKLITLAEEHLHLEITKISIPTVAAQALFSEPLASTESFNDPLLGNRFFGSQQDNTNQLFDFFITHAEDRKQFLQINNAIKKNILSFMLRQVANGADIVALFSPVTKLLYKGPEGPIKNFNALIMALHIFGPVYDKEVWQAMQIIQSSKNTPQILALKSYIESIELKRDQFRVDASTILSYWIDQVKDIYPLPFRGITDFNRLLKEAITALGDEAMLNYFNERVYGAIALDEPKEKLKPFKH